MKKIKHDVVTQECRPELQELAVRVATVRRQHLSPGSSKKPGYV